MSNNDQLEIASQVCGWLYFFAWSISFYGQMYENWKQKNVEGLKLDYVVFNTSGYIFYGVYNTFGMWGDPALTGLKYVTIQDLLFTYHGYSAMLIIDFQCIFYPKLAAYSSLLAKSPLLRKENTVSLFCKVLTACMWAFVLIYSILTNDIKAFTPDIYANSLNMLGYMKLIITLVKYMPQVVWNYQRKSTQGWSIFNIICDLVGGILSFTQNFLDMARGSYSLSGGLNVAKFMLAVITIFFDLIFMVQHYILYPPSKKGDISFAPYDPSQLSSDSAFIEETGAMKRLPEPNQSNNIVKRLNFDDV